MATNCIICKSRCIRWLSMNLSKRNKSKLNQCLETITDTKYKTISLIKELHNLFFHLLITESIGEELSWTLWLITSWESTWEHNHLSFTYCLREFINRISNVRSWLILKYLNNRLCTSTSKCLSAIVLAVSTWKYWNKYLRYCNLVFTYVYIFCIK